MGKIFLSTNEMLSSINASHGLRKSLEIVIGAKSKKADHVQWNRNDIFVCKWKDKYEVLVISDNHTVKMVDFFSKRGAATHKPNTVKNCN